VLAFSPAKFDRDISTLDVSGFAETLSESSQTAGECGRGFGPKISDHRHRRLLCLQCIDLVLFSCMFAFVTGIVIAAANCN